MTKFCKECGREFDISDIDDETELCEDCYIDLNGDLKGSDFEPYSPRCYDD